MKIKVDNPAPVVTITLESWGEIYEMCHRMNGPLMEEYFSAEVPAEGIGMHTAFSHQLYTQLRNLVINANVSS